MDLDQLLRLGVALGIGLLIGLERGWKTREVTPGNRAAGIRTFGLSGLLGGVVAALGIATGQPTGILIGIALAAFAAVIALFDRDAQRAENSHSATTVIAGLLTFSLGALAVAGDMRVAVAAAVATATILAVREDLHSWVARITWPELGSALLLLAMTFIALPLVPDEDIVPGIGVNLRNVWLVAIVLAGVSFAGYVAVKVFGAERGILIAGFAGGLASSTAVTMTSAKRAAAGEGSPRLLAAGVSLASAVSFMRALAIAGFIKPELLLLIGPALGAGVLTAVGYALLAAYWRAQKPGRKTEPLEFSNPFSFWSVVGFAVFLAVVIGLGQAISQTLGPGAMLLGAAGLGLADVDAVAVSMARLVPDTLSVRIAGIGILLAVASNMLSKLVMALTIGRGRFGLSVAVMTVACWVAGLAAFWATLAFSGTWT